jgi:hypothetical protein
VSLRLRHYYMYEHPTSTVVDMPRRMRRRKERRRGPLSVPLRCGLGGPLGDPWGTKIGTQNRKEKKKKKSHQDFAYPGSPQLGQAVCQCTVLYCTPEGGRYSTCIVPVRSARYILYTTCPDTATSKVDSRQAARLISAHFLLTLYLHNKHLTGTYSA